MYFLGEQIDRMALGPKILLSIALAAEVPQSSMNNGREPTGNGKAGDPTVVACVVFQTQDPERLVELLRQALTGIPDQVRLQPPDTASLSPERSPQDFWLKHAEAAEYLGVSKSTLYQYACQQKIECRKLAGRLEYRRSTLDQFKDRRIRPAHRWFPRQGITPPAFDSGK
jgi:excisionase family DNA binding protein